MREKTSPAKAAKGKHAKSARGKEKTVPKTKAKGKAKVKPAQAQQRPRPRHAPRRAPPSQASSLRPPRRTWTWAP